MMHLGMKMAASFFLAIIRIGINVDTAGEVNEDTTGP